MDEWINERSILCHLWPSNQSLASLILSPPLFVSSLSIESNPLLYIYIYIYIFFK